MQTRFSNGGNPAARKRRMPHAALAILAGAGLLNAHLALAQEGKAAEAPTQTVIVTGTVGASEAKSANVSYSILDAKDMGKFTPASADDFLRDMPGVVVESNEGVARNESYTRGMSVGTGSPTSGNFWTAILEDGLPVVPVKFNNFQDSNFFRADITTSRVESVRGGSAGTSVASSAGGVFNFMSGQIQPGVSLSTRLGWEGDDPHLSWKQVDGSWGWKNGEGDLRAGIAGFWRTSTGVTDPGYPLNLGGQVKARVQKSYDTPLGTGQFSLTAKHLDDRNSWNGQFTLPQYGYLNPRSTPGFDRGSSMFWHGGQHTVPTDAVDGAGATREHDPENGARYTQDALWLKWEHETGGPWSFSSALKWQDSKALLQQGFYGAAPVSLWNVNAFQDPYLVHQGVGTAVSANLNRQPGYYELYDLASGAVRARIQNNVGAATGVNYRTGGACPAGSATSPAQCVTYTSLPNADYDVSGGIVNGVLVPSTSSVSNKDVVYVSNSNYGVRGSRDLMLDFSASYAGDNYRLQGGVFAVQADQRWDTYFNGRGLSAFEAGNVGNLGARFVTTGGTYQLTDSGGWGRVGGGYVDGANPYSYRSRQRDIQPMLGGSWSPGKWDLNASYKGTLTLAKTEAVPLLTAAQATSAGSRTYGGIDGNALTWYDNQNYVRGTPVLASKRVYLKNWSASVGYNLAGSHKVYYRHSMAGNNISGIVSRYATQFNADNKPLFPQADLKQDELAWVFGTRNLSGQLTAFRTELLLWQQQTPLTPDGSTYVVEYLDHYLTKGLEGWLKYRITPNLSWSGSGLYSRARALAVGNFAAGNPGPEDDRLTTVAGIMARTPRWVVSNTVSYELGDFRLNLRHRYMSVRKLNNNPADANYLPQQRNTDFSLQYAGYKNLRLSLDIRNLLNDKYISGYGTMLPTATGVTASDIYQQLPDSASWVAMNPPRSFWLTARYDF
jgi:outer membrane cobalamin receptor